MINKIRYYRMPGPLVIEQQQNQITAALYLIEAGEMVLPSGLRWKPEEVYSYYFLVYCTKGEGFISISGEKVNFSQGHYTIIPPGEKLILNSARSGDLHLLTAGFLGDQADRLSENFGVVRKVVPSVNNLVANRSMLFNELFNNLSRGFHNENLEYIHFCLGHLLATFIYANKSDQLEETNIQLMVKRVSEYLDQNLHKKITLSQLAKVAGFSPTYFSTLFSKSTGYAPLSYFSHLKVLKACEFLDYTSAKIKDISLWLGYSDPYYFTRDFKNKMGLSPRNYRKRISPKRPENADRK